MLDTPGAFIGEFDALDGPKVTYAFEYFDYNRAAKSSSLVRQLLCFVEGSAFIGKHVASGLLHRECREYMNSVAAHVLTSNESREERLLYQESGCPCVGSFLFSIPDIVARGEKRRFCLIFLHPSYRELVARWDYLSCFVEVLIGRWSQRAATRYQQEYATLANLERLREESRRKPLRSLAELLSLPVADADGASSLLAAQDALLEEMHCQFEVVLPQALAHPIPLAYRDKDAARRDAEHLLEEQLPLAESSIDRVVTDVVHLSGDEVVLPRFSKQLVFVDSEIVVRPLPLWLLQLFSDVPGSQAPTAAAHTLLRALFSGNQILITGSDARGCAGLAMSLAYTLPSALLKMHIGSDTYRMPYESRILTFSQRALSEYTFATSPTTATQRSGPPSLVRLYDMEADGVVHVRVERERVCSVQDCDQLRRAVLRQNAVRTVEDEPAVEPTTLESRVLVLLQPYTARVREQSSIGVAQLQLLTTQLHQLVSEYVVRGRVYGQLFEQQEVEANSASLSPGTPAAPATLAPSPVRATTSPLSGSHRFSFSGLGWHGSLRGSTPTTAAPQNGSGVTAGEASTAITKNTHLSPVYGKRFQQRHYVFSSFAPEDHAILVFLGSA